VSKSLRFVESLAQAVDAERLLPAEGCVLLGVSGGADSVALLIGLHELNQARGMPWTLHVAHLHHGIRGSAADEDARFVADLATRLGLAVTVERADVPAMARMAHQGMEQTARQVRYAFLERVCRQVQSRHIALAHHADDNVETILHRVLRGTGLHGLAGIASQRALSPGSQIVVVRPLLHVCRKQIVAFLRDRGQSWREDQTNALTDLTRNRIRHEVLPMLESSINKQVREALLRLAAQARLADAYLAETAQRSLAALVTHQADGELTLHLPGLLEHSDVIRAELIRQVFLRLRVSQQPITRRHVMAVLELAARPAGGKQIQLPGRLVVAVREDRLIFRLPAAAGGEHFPEVTVPVPGRTILQRTGLCLETQPMPFDPDILRQVKATPDAWTEYVDFDSVRLPLVVHAKRPGERFWPLGGPGRKKLSDFFNEQKIALPDRAWVPVVCDELGPIWIMGMRIDERVKLRRQTLRVLQMTARPLETRF
jgi:tRNA(Ile)-lysidine synthase